MNLKHALLTLSLGLSLAILGIVSLSLLAQAATSEEETVSFPHNEASEISAHPALGRLPLRFIPNRGQTDPAVAFHVQGLGGSLFFSPQEVVFSLPAPVEPPGSGGAEGQGSEMVNGESANGEWGQDKIVNRQSSIVNRQSSIANRQSSIANRQSPIVNRQSPIANRQSPIVNRKSKIVNPPSVIRLTFEGATPQPKIEGLTPLPGGVNFFLGNDPAQWQNNLPTYEGIVYRGLYPGIDLVYRGTEGRLKSEFVVAPGADPGQIRLRYEGADSLSIRDDGALVIHTSGGELVEAPLLLYQEIEGVRREVEGRYLLLGGSNVPLNRKYPKDATSEIVNRQSSIVNRKSKIVNPLVSIQVAAYDSAYPLIIDPELVFSSYLNNSYTNGGSGIAVDSMGNIYVTGMFNWSSQDSDAFISQLINTGGVYTYGYLTYLGGSSFDSGGDLVVDNNGNIYVAGRTLSNNFPTRQALQSAGGTFLAQLVCNGGTYTLGYSTYLGGSINDSMGHLAVDDAGSVYLVGTTASANFPTWKAVQATHGGGTGDAFVTQIISANGVYTYGFSTYLGGNEGEFGGGIAVDEMGNIYIDGSTDSSNFPTWHPLQGDQPGKDTFVTQIISANGVYTYGFSTYLGSDLEDFGGDIAVDNADNIYIVGATRPYNPFIGDTFVRQLIRSGGIYTYGYSTYLGGDEDDYSGNIALDDAGNVYVAGTTSSDNFPTYNAVQDTFGGELDTFVTKIITANGVLTYGFSTYLGGSSWEPNYGMAVDRAGNVYVTGSTASTDFPVVNAVQGTYGGGFESTYVAVIGSPLPHLALAKSVTPTLAGPGQRLTYTLVVRNSGLVSATNAVISDTLPVGLTLAGPVTLQGTSGTTGSPPILASGLTITAGQRVTVTFPVTVNAGLAGGTVITNIAIVTSSEVSVPVTGTVAITIASMPAITVTKLANVSTAQPGQVITYTYHVSNTGNVSLSGLTATDDKLGDVPLSPTILSPNQSATGTLTYTVVEADLPGPLTNTVVVTGTAAGGGAVTATDEASVTLRPADQPNPAIYLPLIIKNN